jgi:hypothetical protein
MGIAIAIVAALAAGIIGLAARKPDQVQYQRKTTVEAPPDAILPFIVDFRRWTSWSPWERLDPNMKKTYGGPAEGPGAIYAWEGDRKVGSGRMEITDVESPSRVAIKLDFIKPFRVSNITTFTLTPANDGTEVTWTMTGPNPFISKVFGMFMDMDAMIGRDFEAGLASLKSAAEQQGSH